MLAGSHLITYTSNGVSDCSDAKLSRNLLVVDFFKVCFIVNDPELNDLAIGRGYTRESFSLILALVSGSVVEDP